MLLNIFRGICIFIGYMITVMYGETWLCLLGLMAYIYYVMHITGRLAR